MRRTSCAVLAALYSPPPYSDCQRLVAVLNLHEDTTMSNLALIPSNAVAISHGAPMTTSLMVAEIFEKQHFHVLRDIEAVHADCPDDFSASNFGWRDYIDSRGKTQRMVEMTKDGFTFLAMGYTGAKAAAFKVAYIQRFNEMEAQLRGQGPAISARVLVSLNPDGRYQMVSVPMDALVFSAEELPDIIGTTDFPKHLLPNVLSAVSQRMQGGIETPYRRPSPPSAGVSARDSVLNLFRRAGAKGVARRDLIIGSKPFRKLDNDARYALIEGLLREGVLREIEWKPAGRGRPGKRLFLSNCVDHVDLEEKQK
jgi:Rha family phage regulatory protein